MFKKVGDQYWRRVSGFLVNLWSAHIVRLLGKQKTFREKLFICFGCFPVRMDKPRSGTQFLQQINKYACSVDRNTPNTPFLSRNRHHPCSTLSLSFLLH